MPGQFTLKHVKKNVARSFQVISAALLNTEVSVRGGVSSSSCQTLALPDRDMVPVGEFPFLGEPIVNKIKGRGVLFKSHEDILRLQVTVNVPFLVQGLDSLQKLITEQEDSLQGQFSSTVSE